MANVATTSTNGQTSHFKRDSPTSPIRARLSEIIQSRQQQEDRLTQLADAQSRANDQLRNAEARLSDAERALQKANDLEQSRIADSFLRNADLDDDPIAAAKANITTCRSEVDRLDKIERALTVEIQKVQGILRTIRSNQYSILSELICESDEYQALIDQHTDAWKTLRTVKEALKIVTTGCHGYLPNRYQEEPHRAERLEPRVGFPVGPLTNEWSAALKALDNDPDAVFPDI